MNSLKIKSIFRVLVLCTIVATAVGCSYDDASIPIEHNPLTPGNGIHKFPPKKTITIKRKKPSTLNPSPRPLSADNDTNYDEYEEFEIEQIF